MFRFSNAVLALALCVAVPALAEDRVTLYTGNDDHIVLDLLLPFPVRRAGEEVTLRIRGGLLGHWSVWTHKAVAYFDRIRGEVARGGGHGVAPAAEALRREGLRAFVAAGQVRQDAVDPGTVQPPHHLNGKPPHPARFIEQGRGNQHAPLSLPVEYQCQLARRRAAGQGAGIGFELHASSCLAIAKSSRLP